jgi:NMD protein affecting ribosome stability and mRNA decay
MDTCYICDAELHKFMTTPILELPDRTHVQCCEECADREFPGWDEDEN